MLRVSKAKTKCAIPATKIKQPMTSAIPKEIVSGRMMARIPQTKVTMLQAINRLYLGRDYFDVAKNAAERIHDVARIKIARCDFVQHRRKENEILATDQRHLYVSTRESFVEMYCRVEPGKSPTSDDDSSRLHAITVNGNRTRAIEILLMAPSVSLFPSFSQACSPGNFTKFRVYWQFADGLPRRIDIESVLQDGRRSRGFGLSFAPNR
jgi:hypothetical protein